MVHKKNHYFVTLFVLLSALTPTTSNSIAVATSINNARISIKKRTTFAKVMTKALYQHARGKTHDHTIIEKKLDALYKNSAHFTPEQSAQQLYQALKRTNIKEFYLGTSTSAYQIEGGLDKTSAAARFYKNVAKLPTAGNAIDFYHRYPALIKQMKEELHTNAFRISLAWDRIQPEQNMYNKEAIEYYRNVIKTLISHGITPLVVFHHYDVPTWFEDLKGFELQENGKLFQQFCLTVYTQLAEELGDCLVSMCCAPEGPAFKGYFTGEGTPGEKDNLQKTHTVIANMYYEIVDTALNIQKTYDQLKCINPNLKRPSIGTQINVVLLDPHHSSQTNWKSKLKTSLGCAMASYIQSGGTFNFLVNGHYCMYTPHADFMKQAKGIDVYRYHPNTRNAFDWIGVNIYSNRFLNGFEQITGNTLIEEDEERYTDNPNYRNYTEGIYRAVQLIAENVAKPLGSLPIIVTENGIATKDDAKRNRYFQRALTTITALINDGYPVIGYLPWTSHDNYEWPTQDNPEGFNSKCYGFFAVNFDKNSPDYLKSSLKEGACYYANFNKSFFSQA
jgi:beta-glucosidase